MVVTMTTGLSRWGWGWFDCSIGVGLSRFDGGDDDDGLESMAMGMVRLFYRRKLESI
jgi:hypothetical protein